MNAKLLLEHFDRLAEAPDAIPRLRQFILDLAVRGKLVEQNPGDEPASELLKKVNVERARLAKAGELKREKPLPPVEPDESPFRLPNGWMWVRVRHVTSDRGQTVPSEDFTYIDVTAINKETGRVGGPRVLGASNAPSRARKLVRKGDVLYSCVRPYLLNVAVIESEIHPPPIASTAFAVLNGFGLVLARYLWIALRSPFMVETVEAQMRGQAYPAINDSDFARLPLPLPPLTEQHRIVAKVDELMALCDRLEAAQAERERRRDILVAASLHRLNTATDPDAFRAAARFHLRHLPRMTISPEMIQRTRNLILELAARGKLVPQESADEPAPALLQRINSGRRRRATKDDSGEPQFIRDATEVRVQFELPVGWAWTRLGEISRLVTSGSRDWAKFYANEGPIFLRMGNLSRGSYKLRLDNIQRVQPPDDGEGSRTKLEEGDILISITGEVGLLGLIPANFGDAYINQHTCLVRLADELRGRYVPEFLRSSIANRQFNEPQRGLKNSFRLTDVSELRVPLPPLAEQQRIVARLDELMSVCAGLESRVSESRTASRRLLDGAVTAALA